MSEAILMWRCRECGKWSHAKRRPKGHKRWVRDLSRPLHDPYGGVTGYDGDLVPCGPFDPYIARPA